MADWDETGPADDDIVSQFPADERAARAAVKTNFGVDHHETNDADVGKHEVIQIIDNTANPSGTAGEVKVWNNGTDLKMRAGTGAVRTVDAFPSGTCMLFWQASAPTGWTRRTDSEISDTVLRVFSTSTTGPGQSGGSWVISGLSVNNHAITIAELPAHNHGGFTTTSNAGSHNHTGTTANDTHNHTIPYRSGGGGTPTAFEAGNVVGNMTTSNDTHNHSFTTSTEPSHSHSFTIPSVGSGSGHNHGLTADGSWRPKYITCLIAEKD